ncbi:uncharacterized protein [Montipora foliosa]|uniref:uncharacterized protein n=1 Tax=Montipora foliosa TaxID=591990 RepID=UPI0035F1EBC2
MDRAWKLLTTFATIIVISQNVLSEMVVLDHWLLNNEEKDIRYISTNASSPTTFIEGRCPGSKAFLIRQAGNVFNYAKSPITNINGRSFTISIWIKQMKWDLGSQDGGIYGDWIYQWPSGQSSQFLLSYQNRKFLFSRHVLNRKIEREWWSVESASVPLGSWTHVAITWDHLTAKVFIFADGKQVGYTTYYAGEIFYPPTQAKYYTIGNNDRIPDHDGDFKGAVMELYVFGTALSQDEINSLRGVPKITNVNRDVSGGTAVIRWTPPLEGACPVVRYTVHFRVVQASENSIWNSVNVSRNATSYTLHLINCRKEYEIALTSFNGYKESALSESKRWKFKTGGGVPLPPTIINTETEILGCKAKLTWNTPVNNGCPLTMYSVYHQQLQPRETGAIWHEINITDVLKTSHVLLLKCDTQHIIEMSAWNELGKSDRSKTWIIKTLSDKEVEDSIGKTSSVPENGSFSLLQYAMLVVGIAVLLIIAVLAIVWFRRKSLKLKRSRSQRPIRSKSTIIPLLQWEVCPDQVDFKEEIGSGAFGKVLRGIYRESPGIEVFCKSRTPIADFKEGKTVAVKVLGDNEDQDARNQFLEEIELMKAIGSHKNVVSMLGCCVNSEPIFLLLEYLPYGDLQHWLRNKRRKKSYQKFYADDNDFFTLDTKKSTLINDDESKVLLVEVPEQGKNPGKFDTSACGDGNKFVEDGEECLATDAIEVPLLNECCNDSEARLKNGGGDATASIMRNEDLSREPLLEEGLTSRDPQKRVMNQYEDRAGLKASTPHSKDDRRSHEENVAAEDLLCFAWQIARGMSYLSSNGFVHRDLAARNILLGEDRVVKISDFGLMRHVEEGLYTLKKGKKLPVKWTAPEALYNSEYTTKSDVWSFGVVLWELCTMGGNPYPGVNNKELYKLLKTGYRMERPETCSNELFQLVSECWKEEPSERPTFDHVSTSLEKMIMEGTPYLDFELLDESKEYYSERQSENDATT